MRWLRLLCLAPLGLSACAVKDSMEARHAEKQLIGMSEVDLQSCLGAPDQHSTFGNTDVLTYYATSTSNTSISVPVVGGVGLTYGGYCHATFQIRNGVVTKIIYSGEKNALLAPDAYCAPITATCLSRLADYRPATGSGANPASAPVPAGQPGAGRPAAAP